MKWRFWRKPETPEPQTPFDYDADLAEYAELKKLHSLWSDRNIRGIELEKSGQIDEAIALYEANIADGFDGSHPYDRLAIIYRKRADFDNEIRVLKRAIEIFETRVDIDRTDRSPKIGRFVDRLEKSMKMKERLEKK